MKLRMAFVNGFWITILSRGDGSVFLKSLLSFLHAGTVSSCKTCMLEMYMPCDARSHDRLMHEHRCCYRHQCVVNCNELINLVSCSSVQEPHLDLQELW